MSTEAERSARESLAAAFRGRLLVDDDAIAPMLVDWRGRYRGRALAVAMPDDTEGVAAVVDQRALIGSGDGALPGRRPWLRLKRHGALVRRQPRELAHRQFRLP